SLGVHAGLAVRADVGTPPATSRASAEHLLRRSSIAAEADLLVRPAQNNSEHSAVSEAAPTSASRAGLCLCRRRALPLSVNSASVTNAQIDRLVYDPRHERGRNRGTSWRTSRRPPLGSP